MDVCGMERTPVHILSYMGRTSNNNKMLINNSYNSGCIHSDYGEVQHKVYG